MRMTKRLRDGQAKNACETAHIVRCRDCKHARKSENAFDFDGTPLCECAYMRLPNRWHEYCSWGQRKDGDVR